MGRVVTHSVVFFASFTLNYYNDAYKKMMRIKKDIVFSDSVVYFKIYSLKKL